jgi:type IV fimbrial biogenesis protein FimT
MLNTTHKKHDGFTLTEILITLSIISILLSIAAPSFSSLITEIKITTQSNELLSMLILTRSEAIKRNQRVTMCKSANNLTCTNEGNWDQGWIIFTDNPPIGETDENDVILRTHATLTGNNSIIGNQNVRNYISYTPNGRSTLANNALQGGTLYICNADNLAKGKKITLSLRSSKIQLSKITQSSDCT